MKRIIPIILCAAFSIVSGCRTTNPTTGQREFDPVKTEQVKAVVEPLIASGIKRAILHNPDNAKDIAAYLRAVGSVFCRMDAEQKFEPSWLLDEVANIVPPDAVATHQYLTDIANAAVALYRVYYADRFTAELAPDRWPAAVADVMCSAIDTGLSQAGQGGLP